MSRNSKDKCLILNALIREKLGDLALVGVPNEPTEDSGSGGGDGGCDGGGGGAAAAIVVSTGSLVNSMLPALTPFDRQTTPTLSATTRTNSPPSSTPFSHTQPVHPPPPYPSFERA
ncbi:hypothetical protein M0802_003845 [Mischocyttarus mexicanus]|nr:hypothetical protein M0802_003845 [Mischocyttarus mexicanus]